MFTKQWVHQVRSRDSRNLVTPFMQAGNKPARYYATLRASGLGPLFTRAYLPWTGVSLTGSEQESAPILKFSLLQGPKFLVNSRIPFVIETCFLQSRHPLSQSYRAILPNSLRSIISIRLSLLSQSTCPSSRYGYLESFSFFFLWVQGISQTFQLSWLSSFSQHYTSSKISFSWILRQEYLT